MVYASLPSRRSTTRWKIAGHRAVALLDGVRWFLGALLIIDAVRSFFTPDASLLGVLVRWPGGGPLPALDGVLLGTAFLFRSRASALVLVAHSVLAVINIGEFYVLRSQGLQAAALPFSLITLGLFAAAIARTFYDGPSSKWTWYAAGGVAAGPLLLLLHIFSFGATDYARPAPAIVVFGAGVYVDGTPSLALEDRMKHGVRLYHARAAPKLILSGASDEVPVMRRLALEWRVPESALVLDPAGVNSFATLANLKEKRVLAVSHYYHLARIKLAARRLGIDCVTSPCRMTRRLRKEPYYVARECAAFVSYYLFRG